MRLLIDCHVFDGAFQGTRTYLEGLYVHMTHHRDIDFYFASQNLYSLKKVFGKADNVHYVQLSSSNKWKRLIVDFPRIIRKYDIDYAHYQYITPMRKCCKEIVTLHDLLFMDMPQFFTLKYSIPKKILFKRSAKRADILLTVSEYSKKSIVRNFGIDSSRIFITYNSILSDDNVKNDINLKSKYGIDKFILTVSRIEPRKNHLLLLKAYNELKLWNAGYHLVMVGSKDLEYKDFFTYLTNLDNSVIEKIHLIQVPFEDLVALYKNASLFVFPSLGEGFGIPPLEALAYGTPLLCSNVTAMAEFGFPESILFNPLDLDDLKRKIMQQLAHPSDLSIIRKSVFIKYDWVKIADKFYDILTSKMFS